jgi:IclR family pca regulon transcriptional regulator
MLRIALDRMKMEALTRYTIVDPQALWEDLIKTRRRGYSISDRELSIALYSVGVPVLDFERRAIAALNLSLAADETGSRRKMALEHLKRLGGTLSSAMGYEGDYPWIAGHRREVGES